jgi:mono/diheme cytochrome c family protein
LNSYHQKVKILLILALWGCQDPGEVVFREKCISCHRENNDLVPPAPIFTDYRIKADYVEKVLREGVEGTAMRPFNELSEREIKAVSRYIEKLTKREVKVDSSLISRGRYLFENVCSSCHGINGDGEGVGKIIPPPPDFSKFNPLPQTTIRVLNEGIKGTNMYSFREILTEDDKRAVAEYILLFFRE